MAGPPGGGSEDRLDEFGEIARLFRPLTGGAPEALGLQDDAAVLPARPGFELVVSQDMLVEGVHFLPDDPPELVARKLLRVNLSDLAAKAAEPYGWWLGVAWPDGFGLAARESFAGGLALDQARFGVRLFGGDTVRTPGPLTLSATVTGYAPQGRTVRRSGARVGDVLLVSGTVGDAALGLLAAERLLDAPEPDLAALAARYRLPEPRSGLTPALRAYAKAGADVSDGLLADAGHVAEASGLGLEIALERTPLSPAARRWLERQGDRVAGLLQLAAGGDDYEIVCAADPAAVQALQAAAANAGIPLTPVGRFTEKRGLSVRMEGAPIAVERFGWRHA